MNLTVVCSKWGDIFGPEYVNRLYNMVERNLKIPFQFCCFTDDPQGLDRFILPLSIDRWWRGKPKEFLLSKPAGGYGNLFLFRRDFPFEGRILYLDLDVVVTGDLIPLVLTEGDFIAIWDWWSNNWNGSVNLFTAHSQTQLWDDLDPVRPPNGNGQRWLLQKARNATAWSAEWVRSYKIHCRDKGIPDQCKVVVFHGQPKPHEVEDHWVKNLWT